MSIDLGSGPYEGLWWIPGRRDRQIGGVLELGQKFELRTMGSFADDGMPRNQLDARVLHGLAPKRAITLLDCKQRNFSFTLGGLTTLSITAQIALIGHYHLDDEAKAIFDRVIVELDNLTAWAQRRRIETEYSDNGQMIARHVPQTEMAVALPDATLRLRGRLDFDDSDHRVAWEHHEQIVIELAKPLPILELENRYIRPLRYLLNLATGETCNVQSFSVANSAHLDPRPGLLWFAVDFYQGRVAPPPRKSIDPHDMVFTLDQCEFGKLIPRWFEIIVKFGISLDLLFALSSPGNIYVSNRLFNAVSAVEGLHQRLYPDTGDLKKAHRRRVKSITEAVGEDDRAWLNERLASAYRPLLRQRLAELLDRAGSTLDQYVGNRDEWIKKVKKLRDLIGHGVDQVEKDLAMQVRLTATVELLYRVILLRELGFTNEQCVDIVTKNRNWSYLPAALRRDVPDLFA